VSSVQAHLTSGSPILSLCCVCHEDKQDRDSGGGKTLEDHEQGDPASNKENYRPGTTVHRGSVPWWRRYWRQLAKWGRTYRRELAKWGQSSRPELAKVVYMIEMKLLQADLFRETAEYVKVQDKLNCIRQAEPEWRKNLNRAHGANHELNQLLPLIASDEYLSINLEYEFRRREHPEGGALITGLFDQMEIAHLLEGLRGPLGACTPPPEPKAQELSQSKSQDRRRAEQVLKRLYEVRDESWTYERALMRLKRNYLIFHAVIVGVFLVLLGVVIISVDRAASQSLDQLLLVTLAGALGSTLAATLKLRDAVVRLNDLLAVVMVALVQALIGASLGLVAWLLLTSGAVPIGGGSSADWETYALVAFASGFSEPFSLGLIARFIGTG
jgi:hypothetical protein